ncbi:type II CRISPR-associated endonuclease Cas1 [Holzapfeliella sp. JNUCC 80]
MGYRNILISHEAKLYERLNQLVIKVHNTEYKVPLNDMNSLIVDNQRSIISTGLFAKLAEEKVVCFICDSKHIPCGVMTSFQSYYHKLPRLEEQFKLSSKVKGRLWRKIVRQKVINQAQNIKNVDQHTYNAMNKCLKKVSEYDKTNQEAVAARLYFEIVFDSKFTRRTDNL